MISIVNKDFGIMFHIRSNLFLSPAQRISHLNNHLSNTPVGKKRIIKSVLMNSATILSIASASGSHLNGDEGFGEPGSPGPSGSPMRSVVGEHASASRHVDAAGEAPGTPAFKIHSVPMTHDVETPAPGSRGRSPDSPYAAAVSAQNTELMDLFNSKLATARKAQRLLSAFLKIVNIDADQLQEALSEKGIGAVFGQSPTRETFLGYNTDIVSFMKWIVEQYPHALENLKQAQLLHSKALASQTPGIDSNFWDELHALRAHRETCLREHTTASPTPAAPSIQSDGTQRGVVRQDQGPASDEATPLLRHRGDSPSTSKADEEIDEEAEVIYRTKPTSTSTKLKFVAIGAAIMTPVAGGLGAFIAWLFLK